MDAIWDPNHTGGETAVWTRVQSFYPRQRFVTYDVELVLRVARYYAERGQLDPSCSGSDRRLSRVPAGSSLAKYCQVRVTST